MKVYHSHLNIEYIHIYSYYDYQAAMLPCLCVCVCTDAMYWGSLRRSFCAILRVETSRSGKDYKYPFEKDILLVEIFGLIKFKKGDK